MILKKLKIDNFRNIKNASFDFSDKINIIFGDNAQGKSNILESIWYFAAAKGFRSKNDTELINFDSDYAKMKSNFLSCGREMEADAVLYRNKPKKITLCGAQLDKSSRLLGNLRCILFTPEDLLFIKQGPSARRRFMDIALCQESYKYLITISSYNRLLKQRNALLKELDINNINYDLLDAFDIPICKAAGIIAGKRFEFINKINDKAKNIHSELSVGAENLSCNYINSIIDNNSDIDNLVDYTNEYSKSIFNLYKKNIREDIILKSTKYGIHKDDIDININNLNAREFASQGQQKSAVLSIKIAQSELIFDEIHEYPVILLDDIISELDKNRQDFILNKIASGQVILTLCDKNNIDRLNKNLSGAKLFKIKNGCIV